MTTSLLRCECAQAKYKLAEHRCLTKTASYKMAVRVPLWPTVARAAHCAGAEQT